MVLGFHGLTSRHGVALLRCGHIPLGQSPDQSLITKGARYYVRIKLHFYMHDVLNYLDEKEEQLNF